MKKAILFPTRKTFTLQSIMFFSTPITFHSILSYCNPFCSKPNDHIRHLLSYSIAKPPCCDPFSSFQFIYVLIWFIDSHNISWYIVVLWSIQFQSVLIGLIISHHVPYWNLHNEINSFPFGPNLICQLL